MRLKNQGQSKGVAACYRDFGIAFANDNFASPGDTLFIQKVEP